jgi:hypothetical protein
MPKIVALQPPVSSEITGAPADSPQYRNLADLPQRPAPPDSAQTDETVRSLSDERTKTTGEIQRLRGEPFATPEPGMRLKVEE